MCIKNWVDPITQLTINLIEQTDQCIYTILTQYQHTNLRLWDIYVQYKLVTNEWQKHLFTYSANEKLEKSRACLPSLATDGGTKLGEVGESWRVFLKV